MLNEIIQFCIHAVQYVLHIGPHIADFAAQYGTYVYLLLFMIVFCETGVILTPVLPGDSMLFVTGALAASGKLNLYFLIFSLTIAAILGYWFNYWMGLKLAHQFNSEKGIRFIKKEYFTKTEEFYKKYGPKAVVLARFMPFTRTFAPFLAGVGNMKHSHFAFYNIISAFMWIPTMVICGYFFGNIPFIRDNFTYVIITIVIVSALPIVLEFFKHQKKK